jgi:hypothetical protein
VTAARRNRSERQIVRTVAVVRAVRFVRTVGVISNVRSHHEEAL